MEALSCESRGKLLLRAVSREQHGQMGRFKQTPEQPHLGEPSVPGAHTTAHFIIASQLETFLITNSEDDAVNGAEHDRAFPRSRMNSM